MLPETKELAKLLVQAWNEGKITKSNLTHYAGCWVLMPNPREGRENFDLPSKYGSAEFTELVNCELIKWDNKKDLTLFQALRDAVNNDFENPNNATGFNINGNVGSINTNSTIPNQQNVGVNYGLVNITSQEIAGKLIEILGQSLIDSHEDLRLAIEELKSSDEKDKPSRFKRVATLLVGMLSFSADVATIASGLGFLISLL